MDRSRAKGTRQVPASSRLTLRAEDPAPRSRARKNRRRPGTVWSRLPRPRAVADACGRAVRRTLPAIAAMVALAIGGGALWLGHRWVTTSDRFAITDIEVRGADRLRPDDVRAALGVRPGDNVFAADLDAAGARLRDQPWIAQAEVRRVLPDRLVVEIREYEPAAVVALGELYLVDATGHPFKRAELEAGDGDGLPSITGLERASYQRDPEATARTIVDALAVLARWQAGARPAIGELHVGAHGQLALYTYDTATAIELGTLRSAAELSDRIATFDAAWGGLADGERARARAIHLDTGFVTVAMTTPEE